MKKFKKKKLPIRMNRTKNNMLIREYSEVGPRFFPVMSRVHFIKSGHASRLATTKRVIIAYLTSSKL